MQRGMYLSQASETLTSAATNMAPEERDKSFVKASMKIIQGKQK
jgi:hypothetical protein